MANVYSNLTEVCSIALRINIHIVLGLVFDSAQYKYLKLFAACTFNGSSGQTTSLHFKLTAVLCLHCNNFVL